MNESKKKYVYIYIYIYSCIAFVTLQFHISSCFDDETLVDLKLTSLMFLFQDQSSNIGHPPWSFEEDASTVHMYTCYSWLDKATKVPIPVPSFGRLCVFYDPNLL